jgi:hypothetical protein
MKKFRNSIKASFGRGSTRPNAGEPQSPGTASNIAAQPPATPGGSPSTTQAIESSGTTATASSLRESKLDLSQLPTIPEANIQPATAGVPEEPGANTHERSNTPLESAVKQTKASRSLSQLNEAIDDFRRNYEEFARKNRRYVLIDTIQLDGAFQSTNKSQDIKHAAKTFEHNVSAIMETVETKNAVINTKWTKQVGNFLAKLYPVAILSCGLTAAVAEVPSRLESIMLGIKFHAFERCS